MGVALTWALVEQEIQDQLARYLAGQLSLNEFRLWLMPLLWVINRHDDPRAFRTASRIALYIAEFGAGHRTEEELRRLIGPFVLPPPMHEDRNVPVYGSPACPLNGP